jgi:hypothetical protein
MYCIVYGSWWIFVLIFGEGWYNGDVFNFIFMTHPFADDDMTEKQKARLHLSIDQAKYGNVLLHNESRASNERILGQLFNTYFAVWPSNIQR